MCKIPSSTHSCVLRGPNATIPEIPSHEVWTDIVSLCLPGRSLTWMGIFTDVALSSVFLFIQCFLLKMIENVFGDIQRWQKV